MNENERFGYTSQERQLFTARYSSIWRRKEVTGGTQGNRSAPCWPGHARSPLPQPRQEDRLTPGNTRKNKKTIPVTAQNLIGTIKIRIGRKCDPRPEAFFGPTDLLYPRTRETHLILNVSVLVQDGGWRVAMIVILETSTPSLLAVHVYGPVVLQPPNNRYKTLRSTNVATMAPHYIILYIRSHCHGSDCWSRRNVRPLSILDRGPRRGEALFGPGVPSTPLLDKLHSLGEVRQSV